MNHQGTLARSEYPQHLGKLASQDMGPMLTMLALLAPRAELHSFGPRLTRHGTRVNHACPPRLPFTLDVELGQETLFRSDLATHTCRNIISGKDFYCTSITKTKATHARFDWTSISPFLVIDDNNNPLRIKRVVSCWFKEPTCYRGVVTCKFEELTCYRKGKNNQDMNEVQGQS